MRSTATPMRLWSSVLSCCAAHLLYRIPSCGPQQGSPSNRQSTSTETYLLSLHAGQLQGERQRFRVTGASRTYVSSHSWLEVDYAGLAHNAQARSEETPLLRC